MSGDAEARRQRLVEVYREASGCTLCPLARTRTKVVFGAGDADADLMFIGEAPGAEEDKQGLPFVGRAGGLLNELLAGIGLSRQDVFVSNTLKCLRYTAQVQLGDGSWERVGRLVRSRYSGEVMSVSEDGCLVPRRVVGWHATPVADRRVFKLSYDTAKHAGPHSVGVQLTGDHPVLTERGYVPVQDLRPDDRVSTGQGLDEMEFEVICGTLLGDSSIPRKSACLTMSHSARQADYARFKAGLLAGLDASVDEFESAAVVGGRTYPVVHVRTLAHRALGTLRRDFYAPEKVVPEWLPSRLTERMLAIWFMDDGHTRIRGGKRGPQCEIATNAFSDGDLQRLLEGLWRLELPAKASRSRLYFDVPTSRRLCERIARFVPPSMRYKLDTEIESRIPFDPAGFAPGRRVSLFDTVAVRNLTHQYRADTTFFCIDVEDTHNFVTAGGVVHNCRPPGNRDPQPIELESCRPYLLEQVELIQPRVIATLGNFATKLITGNPTGITRVRGKSQVHTLGERTLRVFPLLHPAAILRNPGQRPAMEEDFAALAALLGKPPLEQAEVTPPELPPARPPAPPAEDQLDFFTS